jgi:hypothetical protein
VPKEGTVKKQTKNWRIKPPVFAFYQIGKQE